MIDSSELVDSAINDTVFVHLLGGLDKSVSTLKGTKSTSCGRIVRVVVLVACLVKAVRQPRHLGFMLVICTCLDYISAL